MGGKFSALPLDLNPALRAGVTLRMSENAAGRTEDFFEFALVRQLVVSREAPQSDTKSMRAEARQGARQRLLPNTTEINVGPTFVHR